MSITLFRERFTGDEAFCFFSFSFFFFAQCFFAPAWRESPPSAYRDTSAYCPGRLGERSECDYNDSEDQTERKKILTTLFAMKTQNSRSDLQ
jgi:hypothetical protein